MNNENGFTFFNKLIFILSHSIRWNVWSKELILWGGLILGAYYWKVFPIVYVWLLIDFCHCRLSKSLEQIITWVYLTLPSLVLLILFRIIAFNLDPQYWTQVATKFSEFLALRTGINLPAFLVFPLLFFAPLTLGFSTLILILVNRLADWLLIPLYRLVADGVEYSKVRIATKNWTLWTEHYLRSSAENVYNTSNHLSQKFEQMEPRFESNLEGEKSGFKSESNDASDELISARKKFIKAIDEFKETHSHIIEIMLMIQQGKGNLEERDFYIDDYPWEELELDDISLKTTNCKIHCNRDMYLDLINEFSGNRFLTYDYPMNFLNNSMYESKEELDYGDTESVEICGIPRHKSLFHKILTPISLLLQKHLLMNNNHDLEYSGYKITITNLLPDTDIINQKQIEDAVYQTELFMQGTDPAAMVNPSFGFLKAAILAESIHATIRYRISDNNEVTESNRPKLYIDITLPIAQTLWTL